MGSFDNNSGRPVLFKMIEAIQKNKDLLSELDGKIGDGDHGMNMNKGFTLFGRSIGPGPLRFTSGLAALANILLTEIGGSMGPLYGTLFGEMAAAGEKADIIGTAEMTAMMSAGLAGLYDIIDARVGDKTLIDTLAPACAAMLQAEKEGCALSAALCKMNAAAKEGCRSTKDLAAKYGRSARLGERSRGVADAGATSCQILLEAMAGGLLEQIY